MHDSATTNLPRLFPSAIPIGERFPALPRPAAQPRARRRDAVRVRRSSPWTFVALATLVLALLITASAEPLFPTAPPREAPPIAPVTHSWLAHSTLLTVYGRSFGTAPILGRLGMDRSIADVARQVRPYRRAIAARVPSHHVEVALHLIYGLATPCASAGKCLLYLDQTGVNIVRRYIEPAARRGWLVVLDDQLGRSNPVAEMKRLIARGYMRYDNVEVAFDPEFRTSPTQAMPGNPVGSVTAGELDRAQRLLGGYAAAQHLAHRKLMLVHQWTGSMIRNRARLRTTVRGVQPVVIMDAFGAAPDKTNVYDRLMNRAVMPRGVAAGIKLFPSNPYEQAGHMDEPVLSWNQLFGHAPVPEDNGLTTRLSPAPRVIVMT
jgi:hypothetical protein